MAVDNNQTLLCAVSIASERIGLRININKTKFMIISRNDFSISLHLNGVPIERVTKKVLRLYGE